MTGLLESIAWDSMAKTESSRKAFKLFHDGFRCDSLLSGLYRNFLIADRIMRSYGCNPECSPELPKVKISLFSFQKLKLELRTCTLILCGKCGTRQ